jgi:replicative DNA helicase
MIFLKALPASIDSEYYVLSNIINYGKINEALNQDCFLIELNKYLFLELKKNNNIQKIIEENPMLESHIKDVLRQNVSIAKTEHHIERLIELRKLRKIIEISDYMSETAYNKGDIEINTLIKQLLSFETIKNSQSKSILECAEDYFENYENKTDFILTYFRSLDKILKLERSDLVILAARPGLGKTAFQLQLAFSNLSL